MPSRSPHVSLLPVALACALLAGACVGSSPPARFYVLSALPGQADAKAAPSVGTLIVGPVTLPPEIDRPQLVTRLGPYERRVHETARWAAPLTEHVARVLAEDLAARLPSSRVLTAPLKERVDYDRRVGVDVVAFDAVLGGECELTVRWTVHDGQGALITAMRTTVRGATDGDRPEDVVAAMSGCLAAFADAVSVATVLFDAPEDG